MCGQVPPKETIDDRHITSRKRKREGMNPVSQPAGNPPWKVLRWHHRSTGTQPHNISDTYVTLLRPCLNSIPTMASLETSGVVASTKCEDEAISGMNVDADVAIARTIAKEESIRDFGEGRVLASTRPSLPRRVSVNHQHDAIFGEAGAPTCDWDTPKLVGNASIWSFRSREGCASVNRLTKTWFDNAMHRKRQTSMWNLHGLLVVLLFFSTIVSSLQVFEIDGINTFLGDQAIVDAMYDAEDGEEFSIILKHNITMEFNTVYWAPARGRSVSLNIVGDTSDPSSVVVSCFGPTFQQMGLRDDDEDVPSVRADDTGGPPLIQPCHLNAPMWTSGFQLSKFRTIRLANFTYGYCENANVFTVDLRSTDDVARTFIAENMVFRELSAHRMSPLVFMASKHSSAVFRNVTFRDSLRYLDPDFITPTMPLIFLSDPDNKVPVTWDLDQPDQMHPSTYEPKDHSAYLAFEDCTFSNLTIVMDGMVGSSSAGNIILAKRASVHFMRCEFSDIHTTGTAGIAMLWMAYMRVTECIFRNISASYAGLFRVEEQSHLDLFASNATDVTATSAGGLGSVIFSSARVVDCVFDKVFATRAGLFELYAAASLVVATTRTRHANVNMGGFFSIGGMEPSIPHTYLGITDSAFESFQSSTERPVLYPQTRAHINVTRSFFNESQGGFLISQDRGTIVNVQDSRLHGLVTSQHAVVELRSTMELVRVEMKGCKTTQAAGIVMVHARAHLSVSESIFSTNGASTESVPIFSVFGSRGGLVISDTMFLRNAVSAVGMDGTNHTVALTNVSFANNSVKHGAALMVSNIQGSRILVSNSSFIGNDAVVGGVLYAVSGIEHMKFPSSLIGLTSLSEFTTNYQISDARRNEIVFENSEFVNNTADYGGVMFLRHEGFASDLLVDNTVKASGNMARQAGGLVYVPRVALLPESVKAAWENSTAGSAPYGSVWATAPMVLDIYTNNFDRNGTNAEPIATINAVNGPRVVAVTGNGIEVWSGQSVPRFTAILRDEFGQTLQLPEMASRSEMYVMMMVSVGLLRSNEQIGIGRRSFDNDTVILAPVEVVAAQATGNVLCVFQNDGCRLTETRVQGVVLSNSSLTHVIRIEIVASEFGFLQGVALHVPLNIRECPSNTVPKKRKQNGVSWSAIDVSFEECLPPMCLPECVNGQCMVMERNVTYCLCNPGFDGATCSDYIMYAPGGQMSAVLSSVTGLMLIPTLSLYGALLWYRKIQIVSMSDRDGHWMLLLGVFFSFTSVILNLNFNSITGGPVSATQCALPSALNIIAFGITFGAFTSILKATLSGPPMIRQVAPECLSPHGLEDSPQTSKSQPPKASRSVDIEGQQHYTESLPKNTATSDNNNSMSFLPGRKVQSSDLPVPLSKASLPSLLSCVPQTVPQTTLPLPAIGAGLTRTTRTDATIYISQSTSQTTPRSPARSWFTTKRVGLGLYTLVTVYTVIAIIWLVIRAAQWRAEYEQVSTDGRWQRTCGLDNVILTSAATKCVLVSVLLIWGLRAWPVVNVPSDGRWSVLCMVNWFVIGPIFEFCVPILVSKPDIRSIALFASAILTYMPMCAMLVGVKIFYIAKGMGNNPEVFMVAVDETILDASKPRGGTNKLNTPKVLTKKSGTLGGTENRVPT